MKVLEGVGSGQGPGTRPCRSCSWHPSHFPSNPQGPGGQSGPQAGPAGWGEDSVSFQLERRAGPEPPPAPHPPRASLGEGVPDDPLQKPLPSSHLHPRETRGTPARGSGTPDAMSARSCGREPQGPGPGHLRPAPRTPSSQPRPLTCVLPAPTCFSPGGSLPRPCVLCAPATQLPHFCAPSCREGPLLEKLPERHGWVSAQGGQSSPTTSGWAAKLPTGVGGLLSPAHRRHPQVPVPNWGAPLKDLTTEGGGQGARGKD